MLRVINGTFRQAIFLISAVLCVFNTTTRRQQLKLVNPAVGSAEGVFNAFVKTPKRRSSFCGLATDPSLGPAKQNCKSAHYNPPTKKVVFFLRAPGKAPEKQSVITVYFKGALPGALRKRNTISFYRRVVAVLKSQVAYGTMAYIAEPTVHSTTPFTY